MIIVVEAAAAFEPLITSGQVRQLKDPGAFVNARAARSVRAVDYVRAMQARRIIQQALARLFEDFDLIIAPTVPLLATKLEVKLEDAFAYSDPPGRRRELGGSAGAIGALRGFELGAACWDADRWTGAE